MRKFGFISVSFFLDSLEQGVDYKKYLENHISNLKSVFNDYVLVLSEWGFTKEHNQIHDSLYWGSKIIKFVLQANDCFDLMGYAGISDNTQSNIPEEIFFGGIGLLNKNQIEKPSALAFVFLKKLGSEVLFYNENLIVTKRNDYEYLVIGNNTHELNDYYYRKKGDITQEDMDLVFNADSMYRGNLNLLNLPLGEYKIKTYLVDKYGGDVMSTWKKLGNISNLRSDEFDYLRANSLPNLSLQMVKNSGILTIPITLKRNNFFMTYIYRIF